MELHPDLADLAGFVGTWRGEGEGHYPTIDDFRYVEETVFSHVGKPFLHYVQRTRRLTDDGPTDPLHTETGYLRPGHGGVVEFLIVQPTGFVEVAEGRFDGGTADLRARLLSSATAKRVDSLRRRFHLDEDTLRYDLWMGAVGLEEQHHLRAHLQRV